MTESHGSSGRYGGTYGGSPASGLSTGGHYAGANDYNRGVTGNVQGGGYTGGGAQTGGQYGGRATGSDSLSSASPMGGAMHPGAQRSDYGDRGTAGSSYPTSAGQQRDERRNAGDRRSVARDPLASPMPGLRRGE